jgi:predicted porin
MRGQLLASTAVMTIAALASAPTAAEEPLRLSIGGRYLAAMGATPGEDANAIGLEDITRDYVFKQDVEVHLKGETTLDNGLTVGVRVELEGQTSANDQIDAVYVYFDTQWGELRFGDTVEALGSLCYTVPSASNIFGADSPLFNFSNAGVFGYAGTNGTCYGIDGKSTKIVYFSPTFGGFNFALSFTPDDTEDTRNTTAGVATRPDNNFGQNSENLSIAATYEREFNGFGIVLGGGGSFSFDRENPSPFDTDPRRDFNGYAQFRYAGFTLGGAYSFRDNVADFGDVDHRTYGAGLTYAWSRYAVGFGWTHGEYERGFAGEDDHDVFALTGSYVLGPGITIDGLLGYDNYEDAPGLTFRDYETIEIGLGTSIRF